MNEIVCTCGWRVRSISLTLALMTKEDHVCDTEAVNDEND